LYTVQKAEQHFRGWLCTCLQVKPDISSVEPLRQSLSLKMERKPASKMLFDPYHRAKSGEYNEYSNTSSCFWLVYSSIVAKKVGTPCHHPSLFSFVGLL
jgi:hypothetical protein